MMSTKLSQSLCISVFTDGTLCTHMLNPADQSASPIASLEKSKKDIGYQEATEKNESNMPGHRELLTTFHSLGKENKKELVETALQTTLKELNVESLNSKTTTSFPNRFEKFSGIPTEEDGKPQIFIKNMKDREALVAIRLNNGPPHTMVMFNTVLGEGGTFSTKLQENEGMFHVCSEKDLDKTKTNPMSRNFWTNEGSWLRGERSASKYKEIFEKRRNTTVDEFHNERDAKRENHKKTVMQVIDAEHNLRVLKSEQMGGDDNKFEGEWINMWAEEDEKREKHLQRVETAKAVAALARKALSKGIGDLSALGAQIPETLAATKEVAREIFSSAKTSAQETLGAAKETIQTKIAAKTEKKTSKGKT